MADAENEDVSIHLRDAKKEVRDAKQEGILSQPVQGSVTTVDGDTVFEQDVIVVRETEWHSVSGRIDQHWMIVREQGIVLAIRTRAATTPG